MSESMQTPKAVQIADLRVDDTLWCWLDGSYHAVKVVGIGPQAGNPWPNGLSHTQVRLRQLDKLAGDTIVHDFAIPGNDALRWPEGGRPVRIEPECPPMPSLHIIPRRELEAGQEVYTLIHDVRWGTETLVVGGRIKRADVHGVEHLTAVLELHDSDVVSEDALRYLAFMVQRALDERKRR